MSVSSRSRTRVMGWKGDRFMEREGVVGRDVVLGGSEERAGRRMRRRATQRDLSESHTTRKTMRSLGPST